MPVSTLVRTHEKLKGDSLDTGPWVIEVDRVGSVTSLRVCGLLSRMRRRIGETGGEEGGGWRKCTQCTLGKRECGDADLRRQYQNKTDPLLLPPPLLFKTYVSLRLTHSTFLFVLTSSERSIL